MAELKYSHVFSVKQEAIVKLVRGEDIDPVDGRRSLRWKLNVLGSLGVTDYRMKMDIIHGHIDLFSEPDGEIYFIDNRVTKAIMERLIGGQE